MAKRGSTTTADAPNSAPADAVELPAPGKAKKPKRQPAPAELRAATALRDAIADHWDGSDRELAEEAGVSVSSLADMKSAGVAKLTGNWRKVCAVLKLDPRKLKAGVVAKGKDAGRPELHRMLDRLIGTADEQTVERVMRGLLKAH